MYRRAPLICFLVSHLTMLAGGCAPTPDSLRGAGGPALAGSGPQADPAPVATDARQRFVADTAARLDPLVRALNLAWWAQASGAASGDGAKVADLALRIRALYQDAAQRALLDEALAGQAPGDPLLLRQLQVLSAQFAANAPPVDALAAEMRDQDVLERRFDAFRPELDGRSMTIPALLDRLASRRTAAARRVAYQSLVAIGPPIRPQLLELVRLRNRIAQGQGMSDYHLLRLRQSELDPGWLEKLCLTLEQGSATAQARLKKRLLVKLRRRYGLESGAELTPWLLDDPFFQRLPTWSRLDLDPLFVGIVPLDPMAAYLESLGLPARAVLRRSSISPAVAGEALLVGLAVDRQGDLRLLARLPEGTRWARDLFYELARLVLLARIDPDLPWLLRQAAHPLILDGAARFLSHRLDRPEWLSAILGADASRLKSKRDRLRREFEDSVLVLVRYCLLVIHFERELYRDPEQDLDTLWLELRNRYQGVQITKAQAAAEWPALKGLVRDPVSHQDILLGLVLANQLEHHRVAAGLLAPDDLGRFLVEKLFAPGMRLPWDVLLTGALGESLNPDYLLALFADKRGRS